MAWLPCALVPGRVRQGFLSYFKIKEQRARNKDKEQNRMHNFRQLLIWKEGMAIAKAAYLMINDLPSLEKFGLISQISRCAVSVPSNIAEGSSRSSNKEFAHFLSIALGSLFELETQILLSVDLGFLAFENVESLLSEIIQLQKKIATFKKTLI